MPSLSCTNVSLWVCCKQDEEEEEIDDTIIKPTDAVIVAACTDEEDEYSYLQACNYFWTNMQFLVAFLIYHDEQYTFSQPIC